jgi:hypothetical protein
VSSRPEAGGNPVPRRLGRERAAIVGADRSGFAAPDEEFDRDSIRAAGLAPATDTERHASEADLIDGIEHAERAAVTGPESRDPVFSQINGALLIAQAEILMERRSVIKAVWFAYKIADMTPNK